MRRSILVFLVLVALSFVLIGGLSLFSSIQTDDAAPQTPAESRDDMIRPNNESGFWPWLSPQQGFQKRSSINLVVIGDTETVLQVLVGSENTNWQVTTEELKEADPGTYSFRDRGGDNETAANESLGNTAGNRTVGNETTGNQTTENVTVEEITADQPDIELIQSEDNGSSTEQSGNNETVVDKVLQFSGSAVAWSQTTGATRYAYVESNRNESGQWVEETTQVHDGTYYGQRLHIRMYESPDPDDSWVAMQAHTEHFDWFTLRHRVHGSQEAQNAVESDFMDTPQVDTREDVRRVYIGNENTKDDDGWATFVELAGVVLIGVALIARLRLPVENVRARIESRITDLDRERAHAIFDRIDIRHLGLAGVILAIVLGVRYGGIALERTGWLSMHEIAGLLYPVLALGLPISTYLVARGIERRIDAAIVASGSLSLAVWLDYGLLGVDAIPIGVIVQRMLLVVALGLIASGATHRAARARRVNALLVVGCLLWLLILAGTLLGFL